MGIVLGVAGGIYLMVVGFVGYTEKVNENWETKERQCFEQKMQWEAQGRSSISHRYKMGDVYKYKKKASKKCWESSFYEGE